MKPTTSLLLASAFLLTATEHVLAHHGRDFLLLQDYSQPAAGRGNLTLGYEWARHGSDDEMSLEPGAFCTLLPRIAVGLSASFEDDGEGWNYASVMPYTHWQLTPPDAKLPFRAGLVLGYQFGEQNGDHHEHHEETEETDEHEHEHEAEHAHEHHGIHRHGESFFSAKLILEADLTDADKLVLNLINVTPEEGSTAWGYAAGIRHSFSHAVALGLEAIGDFGEGNEHEIVLGAYLSPHHQFTFNLGVGVGLTSDSPDFSLRTGIVWRF